MDYSKYLNVRIYLNDTNNIVARAYINVCNLYIIKADIRQYTKNGVTKLFVSYPSYKKSTGEYSDYTYALNGAINDYIIDVYREVKDKESKSTSVEPLPF